MGYCDHPNGGERDDHSFSTSLGTYPTSACKHQKPANDSVRLEIFRSSVCAQNKALSYLYPDEEGS